MRWHNGLLHTLVKDALAYSNTTQEILAIACGIPISDLKKFLGGADNLNAYRRGVIKRALGITTPRDRRSTRGVNENVRRITKLSHVALLGMPL